MVNLLDYIVNVVYHLREPGATLSALIPVAEGVWTIHHRTFSVGGLVIGTRSNVIRLPDGTLALHSPGPLDAAALAEVRALGTVSAILAPNLVHNLSLRTLADTFPEARVVAVPGLKARVRGLRIDEVWGDTLPGVLKGVAEVLPLDGCPKLEEQVLFLPATRTLLGVDLVFNLHGMTGFTRFAMWINNANDRMAVTRLARSQFIGDAAAAGKSVRRMVDAWDIEAVVVSHGEVFPTGGREAIREAWSWAG